MFRFLITCAALAFATMLQIPAFAGESHHEPVIIDMESASWKTINDAGVEVAVLSGNPSKPGVYSLIMKIPKGVKTSVHTHADVWRHSVVISGTLYFAFGDEWNSDSLIPMGPGTFFTEGPTDAHYAWAKDGPVVAFLTAMGPTSTDALAPPPE